MSGVSVDPALITRIRMEYLEMPDLRLTVWQARRLWNLAPETCDEILATLVRERFLAQTMDGMYRRRDDGPARLRSLSPRAE